MSRLRLNASIVGCFLVLALARAGVAQTPDKKQEEAVQKIQKLLDETRIDRKQLPTELPLAKLLAALEQQLPKEKRVAIRIDEKAFGAKYAEVAATPIALQNMTGWSILAVLDGALRKLKTPADFRIDAAEVVVTTPQQARFSASYDIRAIVERPEWVGSSGPTFGNADPAQKAAIVVQAVLNALDERDNKKHAAQETIDVLNGNRLVIRATGTRHAQFMSTLQSYHHLTDFYVTAQAQLYEVDDAFYQELKKKSKRLSSAELDKAEQDFLERKGVPRKSLFDLLPKQTRILAGAEVKADNGQEAFLLGRHVVVQCGPGPEQVRKGEKDRQAVLDGVSFSAQLRSSSDRRYVEVKLTEKAAVVEEIQKAKIGFLVPPDFAEGVADLPVLKDSTQTRSLVVPDGGSILLPVNYRPRSVQEKNRWWVLMITARIVMEEEEQAIRRQHLESVLPLVVADVLKNPRLKTTREFYGTPGDKRFALIDSAAWTWPKEVPKVPGFQLTPAKREGNRLLAIRVEKGEGPVTVTLLNAGGSANGPVIGGCTLRYNVRQTEDGPVIALAEPMDP